MFIREHSNERYKCSEINISDKNKTMIKYMTYTALFSDSREAKIRLISLTLRLLMSYIYMERIFLMFLDHTKRRSTVGRTPLDE